MKQLELFEPAKPERKIFRKRNGQYCPMTQQEADKRYHMVTSVMAENEKLKRKAEALESMNRTLMHELRRYNPTNQLQIHGTLNQ